MIVFSDPMKQINESQNPEVQKRFCAVKTNDNGMVNSYHMYHLHDDRG